VTKARRDLTRAKWPFLALTIMVALGVAALTSMYGGYANLQEAMVTTYDAHEFHDGLIEFTPRNATDLPGLGAVEGIRLWEPRLVIELPARFGEGKAPVMARLVSLPGNIDTLSYRQGGEPGAGTVVAESGFAAHHGLKVGDAVTFQTPNGARTMPIAGIATSPEYLWPAKTSQEHMPDVLRRWGVMWTSLDDVRSLVGTPSAVNQVVLKAQDNSSVTSVLAGAKTALGNTSVFRVETRDVQASNVVLVLMVNALDQMALILPLLFLSIVGLSTYVLLTRLVHQQRASIGLLRALGYSPASILFHYLTYAPLIAGAGTLVGFVAGYALSFYVTGIFGSYASLTDVPVRLRWDLLVVGLGIALAFATLASIMPAWKAARLRPSESMRPPAPSTPRHAPSPRSVLPLSIRLGIRNVARNPRRAVLTTLGVALAVSVLVVPQGILDSLDHVVEDAIVRVQKADEFLVLQRPTPVSVIEAAAGTPGVASIEPVVQLQSNLLQGGKTRDITIMGQRPQNDLVLLFDASGDRVRTAPNGIILSRVFERGGYRVGDQVGLYGESLPIVAFVQTSGTTGFVTLETAQKWANIGDAATLVYVVWTPDASNEVVNAALAQKLPIGATQDVQQAIDDSRSMLRLYYGFILLILAFGIIIAGAIVFNTVTINVLEESRDFATLRTMGVGTMTLIGITTTETLLLALPGAIIGLGMGALLTKYFVGVFTSDLFVLDMYVTPGTYALALLAGILAALVSQVPSLRWVARLDLAKATRERAT